LLTLVADVESDIEPIHGMEDSDSSELQDVRAAPIMPGCVRPTSKLKRQAEKVLMTVNGVETRRNKGGKKMYDRMCQWFTSVMSLQ
jgi:hypothetical protein